MTLDAFGRAIGIRPVTEPFKVEFKTYWRCHFPGALVRNADGLLVEASGRGPTAARARRDLASRIRSRHLVVDAGTRRQREFPVPDLTE